MEVRKPFFLAVNCNSSQLPRYVMPCHALAVISLYSLVIGFAHFHQPPKFLVLQFLRRSSESPLDFVAWVDFGNAAASLRQFSVEQVGPVLVVIGLLADVVDRFDERRFSVAGGLDFYIATQFSAAKNIKHGGIFRTGDLGVDVLSGPPKVDHQFNGADLAFRSTIDVSLLAATKNDQSNHEKAQRQNGCEFSFQRRSFVYFCRSSDSGGLNVVDVGLALRR